MSVANEGFRCKEVDRQKLPAFGVGSIYSYSKTLYGLVFSCFLCGCRRQQACDALVQIEQEGHAFGVGGVGFFAAAGLVGGVYGGVEFLVGLEQGRGHGQWVVQVGQ